MHESPTADATPLAVDLDGTLLCSDMLLEAWVAWFAVAPWRALAALVVLRHGVVAFKAMMAQQTLPEIAQLPLNAPLLAWLQQEHARGRRIYLASASHQRYVQAVATHLGIFSGIFASSDSMNMKGATKAQELCRAFGEKQFDYIGNDWADLPVWERASGVIITNASARLQRVVQRRFPQAVTMPVAAVGWRDYGRLLRPHQWLKNMLVFVPILAAHQFHAAGIGLCALAFVSMSAAASSGYVLNDLLDMPHDRRHPLKRLRALAAGRIPWRHGAWLALGSLLVALGAAAMVSEALVMVVLAYLALTVLYSSYIKRQMLLDVILLALLYSIRLLAGGVAVGVVLSPWLLSFATFFFFSLALLKRCAELAVRQRAGLGDPQGRGYRLSDLPILASMAAAAGYVAALTSGLYISSQKVVELYGHPERLWVIPAVLLFWISRVLLLTHRGEMLDDPVLFAARDRISWICALLLGAVLLVSL